MDSRAISQLLSNPGLEFQQTVNCQTGEVNSKRFWDEDGISILIKSLGYGYLKGSLHKYKNNGFHNYDDFTWPEVFETIQRLSDRTKLNIINLGLIQLEWGLNITLDFDPNLLLSGLVRHYGSPFKRMYVFPGCHYVANHNDYDVKIYNKSAQNSLSSHLLRYELSSNKARYFNHFGINCLGNLENKHHQCQLFHSLLNEWKNILLIDPLINSYEAKSKNEKLRLANWKNPSFWNHSSRRVRSYHLEQYEKFLLQKGMCIKGDLGELLKEKFIHL
ncbi:hypothetical protein [Cyclobacterium sp. SYSU L10401]|uniref:hypothetical protein n=1 Tax=Cyclobacterium sp. SYSU L10401 TaxID=2678657 RepID=UPI0013D7B8CF|nr:hypothetical protein [Cyclobacterium sp. SYSU L10401]